MIRTGTVERRTTLLLVRFRYHIVTQTADGGERRCWPRTARSLAFAGSPQNAEWLDDAAADGLLDAEPEANVTPEQAADFVRRVVDGYELLRPQLEEVAAERGEELLDAHRRVRKATRRRASASGSSRSCRPTCSASTSTCPSLAECRSMQTQRHEPFTTVRTEGAMLPADLLQRVAGGDATSAA